MFSKILVFPVDISMDGLLITSHKLHASNVPVVDKLVGVARPCIIYHSLKNFQKSFGIFFSHLGPSLVQKFLFFFIFPCLPSFKTQKLEGGTLKK